MGKHGFAWVKIHCEIKYKDIMLEFTSKISSSLSSKAASSMVDLSMANALDSYNKTKKFILGLVIKDCSSIVWI